MYIPAIQYVKKEDVSTYLSRSRKLSSIVFFSMSMITVGLSFLVYPKLTALYASLDTPMPLTVQIFPFTALIISLLSAGIGIHLFTTSPDPQSISQKLSQYKAGEMINIQEFADAKLPYLFFITMGIVVAFLVFSLISPIYSLTQSLP